MITVRETEPSLEIHSMNQIRFYCAEGDLSESHLYKTWGGKLKPQCTALHRQQLSVSQLAEVISS